MLSLPELDIKYLKTGLDADPRPHKQLKCMGGANPHQPHTTFGSSHYYLFAYILDGLNNLFNKVANVMF